jgi:hypothetical protein
MRTAIVKNLIFALPILFLTACGPDETVTLTQPLQTCEERQKLTQVLASEDCTSLAKGTKLLIVSETIVDELTFECVRQESEQDCRWALGPLRRLAKS